MADIEKIVIITKKTQLQGLIAQFNTKAQANFYINQMGGDFNYYEEADYQYNQSLNQLKKFIPSNYKIQIIDQEFLPNFLFNRTDLIIVIGPDGLVVNTAKYLDNQYILAINPDPQRIDGVLLPFGIEDFIPQLKLLEGELENHIKITMAQAELNNGQKIYGVNDLFIGKRDHTSARYNIQFRDDSEDHSSSGIIVSTGCGSTGWFKSVVTGAIGLTRQFRNQNNIQMPEESEYRFDWNARYLFFSVREPWISKITGGNIIFGKVWEGEYLTLESNMPDNGVIFSDGIINDYINFNSGTIAKIGVADKTANLIVPESMIKDDYDERSYYY
ncbi:MAG: sugar kinase [Promethearchaeota archaeon]|nr:MAG: sugar kinase [Candidatus Lokiarchaeota archaeon]